jgi:hypothetical protein
MKAVPAKSLVLIIFGDRNENCAYMEPCADLCVAFIMIALHLVS